MCKGGWNHPPAEAGETNLLLRTVAGKEGDVQAGTLIPSG